MGCTRGARSAVGGEEPWGVVEDGRRLRWRKELASNELEMWNRMLVGGLKIIHQN